MAWSEARDGGTPAVPTLGKTMESLKPGWPLKVLERDRKESGGNGKEEEGPGKEKLDGRWTLGGNRLQTHASGQDKGS